MSGTLTVGSIKGLSVLLRPYNQTQGKITFDNLTNGNGKWLNDVLLIGYGNSWILCFFKVFMLYCVKYEYTTMI